MTSRFLYYRRVMGSMVVVLLLIIALVRWWPTIPPNDAPGLFRDRSSERIQIREIQPTSQSEELNPPPPAPLPPVVVPNDVLVKEEFEIGEAELRVETPEDDERLQEGTNRATAARQPDTDARLLRNVQPNYPPAARKDGVRARIEIEVKVTETGQVQDAQIRRRWLLSGEGSSRPVPELGYGLEEAALTAARRSLFRPAQANGQPVPTRKVITFTFGPN
jgi:outer membrane biosynthesis protein TonB